MSKKRYRLSGEDIEFINQLRGSEEPVYEITNGRKLYRPLLSKEEVEKLEEFRKRRITSLIELFRWVANDSVSGPELMNEFEIQVMFRHKKKGYTLVKKI